MTTNIRRFGRARTGLGVALAAALLFLVGTAAASAAGTFTDDDGNVHEGYIEAIAAEGITKGCNPPKNSLYCPGQDVSRGAMAAFLVRALGLTDDGGKDWFSDDDGHLFENDINRLAAAGLTKGCNPPSNDRYCPDAPVTRGAMAAFLVRGFGYTDTGRGDHFVDDDGSTFENDIDKLSAAGVTKGCNPPLNDEFCPNELMVRDTMATMLARALGLEPIEPRAAAIDEGSFDAVVRPGDSIQNVVDRLPEGSSVLIKAGTHVGQRVKPKSGMTFVGEKGAVLDGQARTDYAFLAWEEHDADNVTIRGLEIKNYAPLPAMAAITTHRPGWVIEGCHVHHTIAGSGIRVHDKGVIRNCVVHHNDRLGLKPAGDDILVEANEVYANNYNNANDPKWEAGGIKAGGNGLIFRDNHVYGNHGHGIWVDMGAIHVLYENNLIENNTYSGINHEISFDAVIRNNTIRGNGHGDPRDWMWGAGIQVRGPNVEIYGNELRNNKNGVALMQNDRGTQYELRNIKVHHNVIVDSGLNGAVRNGGSTAIFETSHFDHNEYQYENADAQMWRWNDGKGDFGWWQDQGQDAHGSFKSK